MVLDVFWRLDVRGREGLGLSGVWEGSGRSVFGRVWEGSVSREGLGRSGCIG